MHVALTPMLVAAALLAVVVLIWLHWTGRRHAAKLRTHGYSLIDSLKGYSAWVERQRDIEITAPALDEHDLPDPLAQAGHIARRHFPALSDTMKELVQSHVRITEYLWDHQLIRLSNGFGGPPAYQDPKYQQLREAQEELIDDLIQSCRELIGDAGARWHATSGDYPKRNKFSS